MNDYFRFEVIHVTSKITFDRSVHQVRIVEFIKINVIKREKSELVEAQYFIPNLFILFVITFRTRFIYRI